MGRATPTPLVTLGTYVWPQTRIISTLIHECMIHAILFIYLIHLVSTTDSLGWLLF